MDGDVPEHPEPITSGFTNGSCKLSLERADSVYEGLRNKEYEEKEDEDNEECDLEKEDLKSDYSHSDNRPGRRDEDLSYMADLQARAEVKFNKITFCKEFIYHSFFPLSAPLMYYLDGGWWSLINRCFIGRDSLFLVVSQWFYAANFYLMNIVSMLYIREAKDFSFLYDVLLVDLLWGMRNLVVATKYAFLSKIEMEEMRTKKVSPHVHQYRTLLTAWRDPIPRKVLKYELLLAALRNKLTFKHAFSLDTLADSSEAVRELVLDLQLTKDNQSASSFSYGKQADRWLKIGSEELTKDHIGWAEAGGVVDVDRLPVLLYAAHVVLQASNLSRLKRLGHLLLSQHLRICAVVLGISHAILPVAGRFLLGGNPIPGPQWTTYCFLIPGFILSSFAMVSNISFMMIGVLDFRRRHFIAQSLDEVLRTGVYTGSEHVRTGSSKIRSSWRWGSIFRWPPFGEPYIDGENSVRTGSSGTLSGQGIVFDFSTPDSFLAWWTCRQVMMNFGYGFYKRIKYYTTYFAGYCAILLFVVVLKMITGIKKTDIYLLITVIFSIDVFLTLLALMVWPGGDVNHVLHLHGTSLLRRKIRAQMELIKDEKELTPKKDLRTLKATVDIINTIAEGVKWSNAKCKLSICGFDARDQLVSVIVAVVTASMSIGIGQIVQNGVIL